MTSPIRVGDRDGPAGARTRHRFSRHRGRLWSGRNEELLAEAVAGHRGDYVIASKFGNLGLLGDTSRFADGRPEYVREACEKSLRRLQTEVIDLYYIHRIDQAVPIEETVGAMADLVRQGKVRHLGICEAGSTTIRRAHAVHPISAVQIEYSLWSRDVEAEILPLCRGTRYRVCRLQPARARLSTGAVTSSRRCAKATRAATCRAFRPTISSTTWRSSKR